MRQFCKLKLIELHNQWMKNEMMEWNGLCNEIPIDYKESFELIRPTEKDLITLCYEDKSDAYWGCDKTLSWLRKNDVFNTYRKNSYNDLRQTLVLLICAMNNEI